ncbi:MAG: hypothetical protein ACLFP6_03975 [Spirochaetaceae bacterium]
MKKFLITLILLAVIAGTGFFFGWVSFRLTGEEYAVAFTRSDGWLTEPVRPGEFRWIWQALLPTNLTLHRFPLTPREISVEESGTLPSAELYSRYVEGEPQFSYSLAFDLTYRLRPEALAAALAAEETTPENYESFRSSLEASLKNEARTAIVEGMERIAEDPVIGVAAELGESALSRLEDSVDGVEIISLTVTDAEVPDPFIYAVARENYRALEEGRREGLNQTARSAAESRVLDEERRRALEEYGRILREYPVLLDYFRLSAETGADPLELEAVRGVLPEGE